MWKKKKQNCVSVCEREREEDRESVFTPST